MAASSPSSSGASASTEAAPEAVPGERLAERIATTGTALRQAFTELLTAIPAAGQGPQRLARELGLDKVLASRLLKALRSLDPLAVLHHAPGPEPLRRTARAARRAGVPASTVNAALDAVERFEALIHEEAGDRSALGAILSAWLPEARREFEVRRKQAAFKALSQLKGAQAELDHSAVFLAPAADGEHLDVVWLIGMSGLSRLRPGVVVKFDTRRIVKDAAPRRPRDLEGRELDGLDGARLDAFCNAPPGPLDTSTVGDVVHYTLGDVGFGPRSAVDILFAEVNRAEMPRYVPAGSRRRGYVFADVKVPVKKLYLDVFVHQDVYPGTEPELVLYDTAIDGVASPNDRSRDIDRLDLYETVLPLGQGIEKADIEGLPRWRDVLAHVLAKLAWSPAELRGYRVCIEYPLYGSQIVLAFAAPTAPE